MERRELSLAAGLLLVHISKNVLIHACHHRCTKLDNFQDYKCYDPKEKTCCGGVLRQRKENLDCCYLGKNNTEFFNKIYHICCGEKLLVKKNSDDRCCNGKVYRFSENLCCQNNLYNKKKGNNMLRCCGKEAFNPQTDKCCRDFRQKLVKYQLHRIDKTINQGCCGVFVYNTDSHYCHIGQKQNIILKKEKNLHRFCNGKKYDTQKNSCCKGVLTIYPERDSHGCCGTKHYNRDDNKCCYHKDGDFIIPRVNCDCCGYNKFFKVDSEKCCNGNVKTINGSWKECCEKELYNTKTSICCNNQVFEKNGSNIGCCDGKIINKAEKKCCGGKPIELSDTCCNGNKLLENELCCDNQRRVKKMNKHQNKCCRKRFTLSDTEYQLYDDYKEVCRKDGVTLINSIKPNRLIENCQPQTGRPKKYYPATHTCCRGILTRIPSKDAMCCKGVNTALNIKSIKTDDCQPAMCNGNILKPEKGLSCCGNQIYYSGEMKCINNTLYMYFNKQKNHTPNKNLYVCGSYVLDKSDNNSECCRNLLPYNSRISSCPPQKGRRSKILKDSIIANDTLWMIAACKSVHTLTLKVKRIITSRKNDNRRVLLRKLTTRLPRWAKGNFKSSHSQGSEKRYETFSIIFKDYKDNEGTELLNKRVVVFLKKITTSKKVILGKNGFMANWNMMRSHMQMFYKKKLCKKIEKSFCLRT